FPWVSISWSHLLDRLSRLVRRAAGPRELVRLDRICVELLRRSQHLLQRRVEVRLLRALLLEAVGIDPRYDEPAQVRALESLRLERLDGGGDRLLQVHDLRGAFLAPGERLRQLLLEELVHALQDRVVGASRKTAVLLVADAERQERGLLEVER